MPHFNSIECADTTGHTSAQEKQTFMRLKQVFLCQKITTHS